jgi:hypothetical protein
MRIATAAATARNVAAERFARLSKAEANAAATLRAIRAELDFARREYRAALEAGSRARLSAK